MPVSTPLAVPLFITIWVVVLFAVLPFGVRSQSEGGDFIAGTDPGAPAAPRVLNKVLWTTGLSVVVFCLVIAAAAFLG